MKPYVDEKISRGAWGGSAPCDITKDQFTELCVLAPTFWKVEQAKWSKGWTFLNSGEFIDSLETHNISIVA